MILLGGIVLSAAAWRADRKRRAFADQATTPAAAIFAGRNEVKGRAWTATPLSTYRTGTPTVCWDYDLEEERQHTRTVHERDSQGNSRIRTETYYQWHSIDRKGGQLPVVEVVDESGSVPVQVEGARVVTRQLYCEEFRRDDGGGFLDKLFDSRTGRYRETENGIAVGDQLFVVGGVTVGIAYLLSPDNPGQPQALLPGVAVCAVALLVALAVTLYNRLQQLAQAAVRAWSLIDVQLNRRHDLVPALAKVVTAHAQHEAGLLESLTTARTRSTGGDSAAALAGRADAQTSDLRQILARAEAYPELTADQSFLRLQHELADTENRIAGSRTFYNDTLTLLRNKVEGFPGVLVAGRLGLAGRELLPEQGFERTVPHLAPAFSTEAAAARRSP